MAEAGVSGSDAAFGEVLLASKGTSATVVTFLNEERREIFQQPDVRDRMMAIDLEFVPNTPQQANERLHREGTK